MKDDKAFTKTRTDSMPRSRVAFAFLDLSRFLERYLVVLRAATGK